MVLTLLIPLRKALKLEHMITEYHFDNLAKLTLLTGSILFYAYAMEYFVAWYSGNPFEQTTFWRRAFGPMWWAGWSMIICNAFVSQLLWFRKIRTNLTALFIISIFINIGMWFERFVIIASSLSNDYLPYAWGAPDIRPGPTGASWSGRSAGSGCGSSCSPAPSRSWRFRRSRNDSVSRGKKGRALMATRRSRACWPRSCRWTAAIDAIRGLRAQGMRDLTVYSAAPNHEIEDALDHR